MTQPSAGRSTVNLQFSFAGRRGFRSGQPISWSAANLGSLQPFRYRPQRLQVSCHLSALREWNGRHFLPAARRTEKEGLPSDRPPVSNLLVNQR